MQNTDQYKEILSEVIKKQIEILGPDITLAKARNVSGLTIDNAGIVTGISGDPEKITQELVYQFMQLSGLIVKKTMEPLLNYHKGTVLEPKSPQAPDQEKIAIDSKVQAELNTLTKQL